MAASATKQARRWRWDPSHGFVEIREGLRRVDEEVGGVRLGGVRRGGLLVGAVGDEEEEVELGSGSGGVGGYGQAK